MDKQCRRKKSESVWKAAGVKFGHPGGKNRMGNCPWEGVWVSFEALGGPLGSSGDARGPVGSLEGLRSDRTCFTKFDKEKLRAQISPCVPGL